MNSSRVVTAGRKFLAAAGVILCLLVTAAHGSQPLPTQSGAPTAMAATTDGLIASPEPGWPQWRGLRRDGISAEKGLLTDWPEGGPELLWKVDGLGVGWSSPIVVGDRIYITGDVGDDLVVFALSRSGRLQWRVANGKAWEGSFPGARACCAYSQGRLFHLNAHGRLVCLEATTGKELWATNILQRFGAQNITWALSECLLVDGPRVIVTPGGKQALMAALDQRNGQTIWTTAPLGADVTSYCSPILLRHGGRRWIVSCSSAHGFGVDAERGTLLWNVPLKNQHLVNVTTPVYGSGSIFFVTPYGEEGRRYRLPADGAVGAVQLDWTAPLDTVTGGAVLVDGTLFATGYRKSKWWLGIDWETGRTRSECKELTTGAAIYADGRLYCLDERGTVGLLKPAADRLQVVGRFRLFDRRARDAWAHPVLCAGRLYLRYHDTLWCYDVKRHEETTIR
jgi:outer membrane protein assembly factor BamB